MIPTGISGNDDRAHDPVQRWVLGIGYSLVILVGVGGLAPDPTGLLTLIPLAAGVGVLNHAFGGDHFEAVGYAVVAFGTLGVALSIGAAVGGSGGSAALGTYAPLTTLLGTLVLVGVYAAGLSRASSDAAPA